jgi:hypothetical protein
MKKENLTVTSNELDLSDSESRLLHIYGMFIGMAFLDYEPVDVKELVALDNDDIKGILQQLDAETQGLA